jgi:hypothetical protein
MKNSGARLQHIMLETFQLAYAPRQWSIPEKGDFSLFLLR